jgi:hypothetical protein
MPRRIRALIFVVGSASIALVAYAALQIAKPSFAKNANFESAPGAINLSFDDDPVAVALLEQILNRPSDAGSRRALSQHYAGSSPTTSRFFAGTVEILQGGRPLPSTWPPTHIITCAAEDGPESRRAYLDLWQRYAFAEPKQLPEFTSAADEAMRQYGHSCGLMTLWSQAILRDSEWHSSSIPLASQEKAIRILLESEQYAPFHENEPSPQLFLDLGGYFEVARHDYVSAYLAATWAGQRLDLTSDIPEVRERKLRERITRARGAYKSKLTSLLE